MQEKKVCEMRREMRREMCAKIQNNTINIDVFENKLAE